MIGVLSCLNFLYWFFQPEYRLNPFLFGLLSTTICYGILRKFYIWYHYFNISVPPTPKLKKEFTVDILTTYFPGEPYKMIVDTLVAIQKITYPHTTYLCDEANDSYLIKICAELGVNHVTRDNRVDAKAGNINNALKQASGEICVILDPDHIPLPHFLDPIVPHFNDPEIGFVQIVQSYYNIHETLVARGAAEQTFQFYGPMMMSMNSYGTVNAIGANCTFRRAALDSIGGHAPGLSEDMHTSMLLHAKGWKSVYIPQILARGLVPSNLTSFFKQQLKWSRGTFDLLFHVYPKQFKNFTIRQKLHYGLLPLHYLVGTMSFINFLIPILSLLLSETPWGGNILFFGLIILPVSASTLLIRAYIQKWVIEKKERGFHIMGGLLQIATWWVYFLGFIYTLIKKEIPYLPTPKDDEESTNLMITIPNMVIGLFSLFSIYYGLSNDLTPFSIFMAGFALLNALFMFFSVYLASRTTNKNHILRSTLEAPTILFLSNTKKGIGKLSNLLFRMLRPIALPLLIIISLVSLYSIKRNNNNNWKDIKPIVRTNLESKYLGIFYPSENQGLSDISKVLLAEKKNKMSFDIVSLYTAWGDLDENPFPKKIIQDIYNKKSIPMITWEPWASNFKVSDTIEVLKKEKKIFKHISEGYFDTYIKAYALELKNNNRPIFLRFAHEFDNPAYPWSNSGENTPAEFIEAWRHVFNIFKEVKANNVVWVWNPWKPTHMHAYFPGEDYIDWIGVTALNYGSLNDDAKWYEFDEIYRPFHEKIKELPKLPVMLAEFGSLQNGGNQKKWIKNAISVMATDFSEIKSIILFNSNLDENIPANNITQTQALDWKIDNVAYIDSVYAHGLPSYVLELKYQNRNATFKTDHTPLVYESDIKGVQYKKGQNWMANNYVLHKKNVEKDFKSILETGFNTIRYEGSNIYDYNILKYSLQLKLDIIYSFWMPDKLNFVTDTTLLKEVQKNTLSTITKLKDQPNIIGWNIGNTSWDNLTNNYSEPALKFQRKAYLDWLEKLSLAIKILDRSRPLSIDISTSTVASSLIQLTKEQRIPVDYYNLIVKKEHELNTFIENNWAWRNQILIGDMASKDYIKYNIDTNHIILRNWQDQWESHKLSFDGLLDRKGRKKGAYILTKAKLKNNNSGFVQAQIKILRPALLLDENKEYKFESLFFDQNEWKRPAENIGQEQFEWSMIKTDFYGNPLAIKPLGQGVNLKIKIPKDYSNYRLMLSFKQNGYIISTQTTLNTPSEEFER